MLGQGIIRRDSQSAWCDNNIYYDSDQYEKIIIYAIWKDHKAKGT